MLFSHTSCRYLRVLLHNPISQLSPQVQTEQTIPQNPSELPTSTPHIQPSLLYCAHVQQVPNHINIQCQQNRPSYDHTFKTLARINNIRLATLPSHQVIPIRFRRRDTDGRRSRDSQLANRARRIRTGCLLKRWYGGASYQGVSGRVSETDGVKKG